MKKTTWVIMTLLLACNGILAQSLNSAPGKQLQLSVQNGLSSLLASSTIDSVYFVKAGYQAGVEGNYYWNNFGLSGSIGYFSNAANHQAVEDFARSRKAPRDRVNINAGSYKGLYFFTGPAFQSTFNKWRLQSSLEGGLISKPASQVLIGDVVSPDVVYYRNVFDESNSFAWSAGLSVSYALSSQFLLGVNADYLNTKNDVVNYDIQRGGGHEAKNISSQAGFLNTGVKLSYLFNTHKAREAGSGLATGKRESINTNNANENGALNSVAANPGKTDAPKNTEQRSSDTCRCQDKVMEVYEMEPYVVEIQFETVQEARVFLDTYEPMLASREAGSGMATGKTQYAARVSNPLYKEKGMSGQNPLYEKSNRTVSNTQGIRGIMHVNAQGEQAFYVLPNAIDLAEILSLEDGRVTVHVQAGSTKLQSNREAGSGMATGKRTYKAIAVGDLDGDGIRDLMLQSNNRAGNAQPRDITNDPELSWGSLVAVGDVDGDGYPDYCLQSAGSNTFQYTKSGAITDGSNGAQKREAMSGIATGRRQHKTMSIGDLDGDGRMDMLVMSYGHEVSAPKDIIAGQASGRMGKIESFAIKQGIVLEADLDGDGEFEPVQGVKAPRDMATGVASGKRMASKEDVYVWKIKYAGDLDGDGAAEGFVYSTMNTGAPLMNNSTARSFNLNLGDGDDEGGNKKAIEKATSGVKQTLQTQVLMTNNDPNGSADPAQKAGVSTSRSNIRSRSVISCSDGSCQMTCEIELDGNVYTALVTARSRHDTVKNSVGNIR